MYYQEDMKCPYKIIDGVLYYKTTTGKVYKREMIEEISRIFNTFRPVALNDGQKRFMKVIYENELVSINVYLINHDQPFELRPPYREVQELDDNGQPMFDKAGHPIMSGQIIRFHGEVENIENGHPIHNPNFYSEHAIEYLAGHEEDCESPEHYQQMVDMFRETQRKRYEAEMKKIARRQYQRMYARKKRGKM